jgi:hypothetical protein
LIEIIYQNNDPRPKGRDISEQLGLVVLIEGRIGLALGFDVGADGLLVTLSADRAGKIYAVLHQPAFPRNYIAAVDNALG